MMKHYKLPISENNLNYCFFVWTRNISVIKKFPILQKNLILAIFLYCKKRLLKIQKILYFSKLTNNLLPCFFSNWFNFFSDIHNPEMPTFKNQNLASQPANYSKSPKWSPRVKTLKAFAIWP